MTSRRDALARLGALAGSLIVMPSGVTLAKPIRPGRILYGTKVQWHYALADYNTRLAVSARIQTMEGGIVSNFFSEELPSGLRAKSAEEAADRCPEIQRRLHTRIEKWVDTMVPL
jgi:hypothetical protein